jgi:hypothetical protein
VAFRGVSQADTIVDTLGSFEGLTSNVFDVRFVRSAQAITAGVQQIGPAFSLTSQTRITEIGGFLNNCGPISTGCFPSTFPLPLLVEIVPAQNGVPDAGAVPFIFALPGNRDPVGIYYESVDPNLVLPAGNYFALFTAQGSDAGLLVGAWGACFDGPCLQADQAALGYIHTGQPGTITASAAVRILGSPVPEPSSLAGLFIGSVLLSMLLYKKPYPF